MLDLVFFHIKPRDWLGKRLRNDLFCVTPFRTDKNKTISCVKLYFASHIILHNVLYWFYFILYFYSTVFLSNSRTVRKSSYTANLLTQAYFTAQKLYVIGSSSESSSSSGEPLTSLADDDVSDDVTAEMTSWTARDDEVLLVAPSSDVHDIAVVVRLTHGNVIAIWSQLRYRRKASCTARELNRTRILNTFFQRERSQRTSYAV